MIQMFGISLIVNCFFEYRTPKCSRLICFQSDIQISTVYKLFDCIYSVSEILCYPLPTILTVANLAGENLSPKFFSNLRTNFCCMDNSARHCPRPNKLLTCSYLRVTSSKKILQGSTILLHYCVLQ